MMDYMSPVQGMGYGQMVPCQQPQLYSYPAYNCGYYQPSQNNSPMLTGQQQAFQQQQAVQQMQQGCQPQVPQPMQQGFQQQVAQQMQQFPQSYENPGMAAQSLQNILGAVSNSIGGVGNQDTISLQLKVSKNEFVMKFEKGIGQCCNCSSAIEQT